MDTKQIKTESYSHGIDERYWKVKGKMDAYASDFEYYRVTSYENLEVGQCVIFDNRKMYILEKRCKLKNRVLEFEYIGCKTVGMDTKQIKTESYSHGIDEKYCAQMAKM